MDWRRAGEENCNVTERKWKDDSFADEAHGIKKLSDKTQTHCFRSILAPPKEPQSFKKNMVPYLTILIEIEELKLKALVLGLD